MTRVPHLKTPRGWPRASPSSSVGESGQAQALASLVSLSRLASKTPLHCESGQAQAAVQASLVSLSSAGARTPKPEVARLRIIVIVTLRYIKMLIAMLTSIVKTMMSVMLTMIATIGKIIA